MLLSLGPVYAFSSSIFWFLMQSAILHTFRAIASRVFPAYVRHGVAAIGVGICFLSYWSFKAFGVEFLEYFGGVEFNQALSGLLVFVSRVLSPLLAILHVVDARFINPIWPMLYVFLESSLFILIHELLYEQRIGSDGILGTSVENPNTTRQVFIAYALVTVVGMSVALLLETSVRIVADCRAPAEDARTRIDVQITQPPISQRPSERSRRPPVAPRRVLLPSMELQRWK